MVMKDVQVTTSMPEPSCGTQDAHVKPEPGASQLVNGSQSHATASGSQADQKPGSTPDGGPAEFDTKDVAGAASRADALQSQPANAPRANGLPPVNGTAAPAAAAADQQTASSGISAGAS